MKKTDPALTARINSQMRKLGLKNKDIVDATGASKGSVSQWINGGNGPSARYIAPLAKVLQVTEQWLLEGGIARNKNLVSSVRTLQKIPLLSLAQAGGWSSLMNKETSDFHNWINVSDDISPFAFAVLMDNDSMVSPTGNVSIPQGATVIVDPTQEPMPGRVVLAKLDDEHTVTIKKLSVDGPNIYLVPSNSNYRAIQISEMNQIIGVCLKLISDLP